MQAPELTDPQARPTASGDRSRRMAPSCSVSALAMSGATPSDAGLASGLVNTSAQVGAAVGLAVLATLSATRTAGLAADGVPAATALTERYQLGFWVAAGLVIAAIAVAMTMLRREPRAASAIELTGSQPAYCEAP